MNQAVQVQPKPIRIRIFVDFWNFSLSLRRADGTFQSNWRPIGPLFTQEAGKVIDGNQTYSYEGMHVYGSYNRDGRDQKFKNWFSNVLDKMPGVHTSLVQRQNKKSPPKCPSCQHEVPNCPNCGADMRGTEEKGVDTRIVTDMIKLAWVDAYDAAVIVSADRDFVPVAEFLQTRGIKVIHASFPPLGSELSQKCWASFPIPPLMPQFARV